MADNHMEQLRTITGLSLAEALARMAEVLPPQAYKKIGGVGADLTDISPAYLTQVLNEVFGICGIGWRFEYDPEAMLTESKETTTSSGKQRTVYMVTIPQLRFFYRFVNSDGSWEWSAPVIANGGADNDTPEWAMRGALTNALGGAASKLNWQIYVYQGIVDHNNAGKAFEHQQSKRNGGNGKSDLGVQTSGAKSAPQTQGEATVVETASVKEEPQPTSAPSATAEPAPALVEEPKSQPAQAPVAAPLPEDPAKRIEWAKSVFVPNSIPVIPVKGKSLGEIMGDKNFGAAILKFLTGDQASASGIMFEPKGDDQLAVQQAARILWQIEQEKGQSKTK